MWGAWARTDVVICARNEEPTVGAVVAAFATAGPGQVIVVDDGSADGTARAAWAAGATVIVAGPRRGKGEAMTAGLARVSTARVAFADADLSGFTAAHARQLTQPCDGQVCGLRDNGSVLLSWLPPVTGERCLPTALARSVPLRGWGAETALNAAAGRAGLPARHLVMTGVTGTPRAGPLVLARIAPHVIRHAAGLARYAAAMASG